MIQTVEKMSHDLRNTLTSTKMIMKNINEYLPILTATYKKARDNKLASAEISDKLLSLLEDSANSSNAEVEYSGLILKLFSENLKKDRPLKDPVDISIKKHLQMAFSQHPYRSDVERNLASTEMSFEDFTIHANPTDIELIFSGIIHNILSRTSHERFGAVDISYMRDTTHHQLAIKDIAKPLTVENLNLIFKQFSLENNGQTTLFYCKKIMENIGGEIYCQQQNGSTTFLLKFPI